MKKQILVLLMLMIFFLSGCESTTYHDTGIRLDGNKVYSYETNNTICITLYSTTIVLTEDIHYEIIYNCNYYHAVEYQGTFVDIVEYISKYSESIDDVLESGLGFPIYYDSIRSLLDIDINDYVLDEIVIRTLNGEYKEYGGEWTESATLEMGINDIKDGIIAL